MKMAELRFNKLPFKTLEEWEAAEKEEPNEVLEALQKTISKELRRRKAEKKQAEAMEKWAAKHGYELIKKPGTIKEGVTPAEVKPEEKKPAAKPVKM
jgi:hypothetical protein